MSDIKAYTTIQGKEVVIYHRQGLYWLGQLPYWLNTQDPRTAQEQLNEHYRHGGGWNAFSGFEWGEGNQTPRTLTLP